MDGLVQLTYASLEDCLMGGQGPCEHGSISIKNSRNLNEGKTKDAKLDDLPSAHHLFGSIGPPACGGAGRLQQSALLVEPEGFGGYPEVPCRLGRIQELDVRVHESPHCYRTISLMGMPQGQGQAVSWLFRGWRWPMQRSSA